MRRFICFYAAALILSACPARAQEPQAQVIHNPYTSMPPVPRGQWEPVERQPTWHTTVHPATLGAHPTNAETTPPSTRSLPDDCLKALGAAIRVRSPAEAYRATPASPRQDRTAQTNVPADDSMQLKRDSAVQPVTWIADAPPPAATPNRTEPNSRPSFLTTSPYATTRLTLNPYRGTASPATPCLIPAVPTGSGNPLR